jgi:hypothetical protein
MEEEEEKGAEGGKQVEGEEDEGDENNNKDDNEPNKESQTRLNGARSEKEINISIQGKEDGYQITGREKKPLSSVERNSIRKFKRESKRKDGGQEIINSPSKRSKTRALIPTTDIIFFKSLKYIPKSSIQPAEIYKIFLNRS